MSQPASNGVGQLVGHLHTGRLREKSQGCQREEEDQSGRNRYDQSMPDRTPLHQITYPLGRDRADIRTLQTMAEDVDRELGELHGLNDAEQGKLIIPESGSWVPTFAGGWVIGSATVNAEYYALAGLVFCRMLITGASNTNWGTGFPTFTVPFPVYSVRAALMRFSSAGTRYVLGISFAAGSPTVTVYMGGTGGNSSAGVGQYPVSQGTGSAAWAGGNLMYGSFYYRRV